MAWREPDMPQSAVPIQRDVPEVLVRTTGGGWERPTAEGYVNEIELQTILGTQPSLIEGISSDAVALREFSTGVGPADLVILDTNGSITVVECKLAKNQEIRRTIMGQVLDYASRLAEMTPDDFVNQWSAQHGPSLDDFFEGTPEAIRESFTANLTAGVFTLVLAVDSINDDLRRIVRYLNTHTAAGMRLLAIELRRVTYGQIEILIPTFYGSESADDKNARAGKTAQWTHASVDEWLRAQDPTMADAVAAMSQEMQAVGFRTHGGGTGAYPSFSFGGMVPGMGEVYPYSVYCGEKLSLGVNFQWVERAGVERQRRFLADILAAGAAVDATAVEAASFSRRPSIPLSLILDPSKRALVVAAAARLTEPPRVPG
jgi:hypothetical protein